VIWKLTNAALPSLAICPWLPGASGDLMAATDGVCDKRVTRSVTAARYSPERSAPAFDQHLLARALARELLGECVIGELRLAVPALSRPKRHHPGRAADQEGHYNECQPASDRGPAVGGAPSRRASREVLGWLSHGCSPFRISEAALQRAACIRSLCHATNLRPGHEPGIVGRLDSGSYQPTISTPT
jgi:hypothetical protein